MYEVVILYDKPMIRYDVKFTVPGTEKDILGHAHCWEKVRKGLKPCVLHPNRTISHLKSDWLIQNHLSDTNKYVRLPVNNGDYVINFTSYDMLIWFGSFFEVLGK